MLEITLVVPSPLLEAIFVPDAKKRIDSISQVELQLEDNAIWEEFEALAGPVVTKFVSRFGVPQEHCEDVYRLACMELLLRLRRTPKLPDLPAIPLLFQIAKCRAIDFVRRQRESQLAENVAENVIDPTSNDPVDQLMIEEALKTLTGEERTLLMMRREGHTLPEIAGMLGESLDKVKKLSSGALGKLRKYWDPAKGDWKGKTNEGN